MTNYKMKNFCLCKCGKKGLKNGYARGHHMRSDEYKKRIIKQFSKPLTLEYKQKISLFQSQTYEEKWGKEVSDRIKEKRRNATSQPLVERIGVEKLEKNNKRLVKMSKERLQGKTYEEIFGKEKAKRIKEKQSKTLEERFGIEQAKIVKEKMSDSHKIWNKEEIIQRLRDVYLANGPLTRTEIWGLNKKVDFCSSITIGRLFEDLDELIDSAKIKIKLPIVGGRIGKTEAKILDQIEKNNNISLIRQFPIAGKFIDGYDSINNVAYEVDESFHRYKNVEDFLREQKIKDNLNCKFVRIEVN